MHVCVYVYIFIYVHTQTHAQAYKRNVFFHAWPGGLVLCVTYAFDRVVKSHTYAVCTHALPRKRERHRACARAHTHTHTCTHTHTHTHTHAHTHARARKNTSTYSRSMLTYIQKYTHVDIYTQDCKTRSASAPAAAAQTIIALIIIL
jgi:hypothetical protein